MTGTVSWILSLKAIADALIGLGVIKGKNCQVKSIVRNGRATVITFAWYDEDEELQEMAFTMYDGIDGINGVDGQDGAPGDPGANGVSVVSAEITATHHLVFTMSNDTTIDAGVISGGGGEGSAAWGSIGGTITDQTDLQTALNGKVSTVSGKGLSTNDYTDADKEKVVNALTEHQTLKTINGTSLVGSGNIEISGSGDGVSVVSISEATYNTALSPNVFYKFGEMTSLYLDIMAGNNSNLLDEYMFEFKSGATPTTFTYNSSNITLVDPNFAITANKTYQGSIVNGICVIIGV